MQYFKEKSIKKEEKSIEKAIKRYDMIYKKYYRKCRTNLNVERAMLKRDTYLFNAITLILSLFGIYITLLALRDLKDFLVYYWLLGSIVLLGAVGIGAAYRGANNEFKMSVLDDILHAKEEFRKPPRKECDLHNK